MAVVRDGLVQAPKLLCRELPPRVYGELGEFRHAGRKIERQIAPGYDRSGPGESLGELAQGDLGCLVGGISRVAAARQRRRYIRSGPGPGWGVHSVRLMSGCVVRKCDQTFERTKGAENGRSSRKRRSVFSVMRETLLSYPLADKLAAHDIEPVENTAPPFWHS